MATISNTTIPATNEHDYRYGLGRAVDDYNTSSKDNIDLSSFVNSNDDVETCQVVHYTLGHRELTGIPVPGVTNSTACRDGYVAGWKSWCITL